MRQAAPGRRGLPPRQIVTGEDFRPLLRRLAAQFGAALANGSEIRATAGYRVHLWPTPDPFYRNVAIPTAVTDDPERSVLEMLQVFAAHGRTPRLEFFAELWPHLPPVLERAGLSLERRAEVMARSAGTLGQPSPAHPVLDLEGAASGSLLQAFLGAAAVAFGEEASISAPGEVERLADGLRAGAIVAAAVTAGEKPVAGASLIRAGAVAELVGVWCLPEWRRRGLADASCRAVLQRFFAAGGEVAWLSAGDAATARLYRKLGFAGCGSQLNYAGPAVALT